ncbi:WD40 repeat domain-containing protein [Dactylosporangium darangshiense]|uniref:WD40 repeat domain-containing protein n=1 Tax=Dactylosporangium darangshiense TaxID=579108 RepID=UPI00362630AD
MLPDEFRPDDEVFDAALLLTGSTPADAIAAIATAAALGPVPAVDSVNELSAWLLEAMAGRPGAFTVIVDALDEARQPLVIADLVLRRLAGLPRVRLVVGTRRSTADGLGLPQPSEQDILDAFDVAPADLVDVGGDPAAVSRYVTRRLAYAYDRGELAGVDPATFDDVALLVGADRDFLFARLAVHEVIERPALLAADRLRTLLEGDHRSLFATAARRIEEADPRFHALIHALAYARGRGAPIADGVWTTIARALSPGTAPGPLNGDAIALLRARAMPYLMVDLQDGQTVYRLAHRTFQEEVTAADDEATIARRHARILAALLTDAADGAQLNPYVVRHLSEHAALAGPVGWAMLAERPAVLDALDQQALGADAVRYAFGRPKVPAEIAGVIGARHRLVGAAVHDRRGLRRLAVARHTGRSRFDDPPHPGENGHWTLQAAWLVRQALHHTLSGAASAACSLAALRGADGSALLAVGGADGSVQIWDPLVGRPIGAPIAGHRDAVRAMATVAHDDGRATLLTGSLDGTIRIVDPTTGESAAAPFIGNTRPVWSIAALRGRAGDTLVAAGTDGGTVWVWSLDTGDPVGPPLTGLPGPVSAMATFTAPDGADVIVAGDSEGGLRAWDPYTGATAGAAIAGHGRAVTALAGFTDGPTGRALLAAGTDDGVVQLWDPVTGAPAGAPLVGHTRRIWAVVAAHADGATRLATAGDDRTVLVWEPLGPGRPLAVLAGHTDGVLAAAVVPGPHGSPLLATGGHDRTVRIWDPFDEDGDTAGRPEAGVVSLAPVVDRAGAVRLAGGGSDGRVRLWDPSGPAPVELAGRYGRINALATVADAAGNALLATGGEDGAVRLWEPDTGDAAGEELLGHAGPVIALAPVPDRRGRRLLAAGAANGAVHVWDLDTGRRVERRPAADLGGLLALTALPGRRSRLAIGGWDGAVRLWDPLRRWPAEVTLRCGTRFVTALAPLAGARAHPLLAVGGAGGTVELWDLAARRPVGAALGGHEGRVWAMTAIGAGPGRWLLATGDEAGTLRIWDPAAGAVRHSVPIGTPIYGISAGSSSIALGTADGLILLGRDALLPPYPEGGP